MQQSTAPGRCCHDKSCLLEKDRLRSDNQVLSRQLRELEEKLHKCQTAPQVTPISPGLYKSFFSTFDYLSLSRYAEEDSSVAAMLADFVSDEANSARMVTKAFQDELKQFNRIVNTNQTPEHRFVEHFHARLSTLKASGSAWPKVFDELLFYRELGSVDYFAHTKVGRQFSDLLRHVRSTTNQPSADVEFAMGWEDEVNHFYLVSTGLAFTLNEKPKGRIMVSSTDGMCGVMSVISNFVFVDPKKTRALKHDDLDAQVHSLDQLISSFQKLPVPHGLLHGFNVIDNDTHSPPEYSEPTCCSDVNLIVSDTGLIKVCRNCTRIHTPHNMGVLTTVLQYICSNFIEPLIPVTDKSNLCQMQKRAGNSIIVGRSKSGKVHTGLFCSVKQANHSNHIVKKKLFAVSNVTPLDFDEETYEDWLGGRTNTCFFEFPLKAGLRAKPAAPSKPRQAKLKVVKPRAFGQPAYRRPQAATNHAVNRINRRRAREHEERRNIRVLHNSRYEEYGPKIRSLHTLENLSLSDYNVACLQNQISRCFTNDYMEALRERVTECDGLFSDHDEYNLVVESLSWLSSHRSKCDRLTKVREEQVTVSTYQHAEWALGLGTPPTTVPDSSVASSVAAAWNSCTLVNAFHTAWNATLSVAIRSFTSLMCALWRQRGLLNGPIGYGAVTGGLYWVYRQYQERLTRQNVAASEADSIQPSFDKLTSDTDIRRFAQMYSNQTPLPASAIQQRLVTVVTDAANGQGQTLSVSYVNPESRVIYVKQSRYSATARIAYSPRLAKGAVELLDDLFKRPLCDRVFTHCDSQHINHRTINDAHSVINLNSLNVKISANPKCVAVFHAEKYANRMKQFLQLRQILTSDDVAEITRSFLSPDSDQIDIVKDATAACGTWSSRSRSRRPAAGRDNAKFDSEMLEAIVNVDPATIMSIARDDNDHEDTPDTQLLAKYRDFLRQCKGNAPDLSVAIFTRPEFDFGSGEADRLYNNGYFSSEHLLITERNGHRGQLIILSRADAQQANVYSQFVALCLSGNATGLPVYHYLNDVHYYVADQMSDTFQKYQGISPHNCLFISGTNYFPLSGKYLHAFGEGSFDIFTGSDGKLWIESSPSGSSRCKYTHKICAVRADNCTNLYGYKVFSSTLSIDEARSVTVYDGFDSRLLQEQPRLRQWFWARMPTFLRGWFSDNTPRQIASLEHCLLGKSPQLSLLQRLMLDIQPSMIMPLTSCEQRFKLMCTGPTDYSKVYSFLRDSATHRHDTAGIDHSAYLPEYWTRGRVVTQGGDIRQPFKLICTTNCPRSEVDAVPDDRYPVFPANSGIPYGTLQPTGDFREWAFGNSEGDQPFCPVEQQVQFEEAGRLLRLSKVTENLKLSECIVNNNTQLSYERLVGYKRPKTSKLKPTVIAPENAERIQLVIRNRDSAKLPDIDPTQYKPDPYFLDKLGYLYEVLYEHRDCFINRRGVITTKEGGGMFRTRQLCDVIDLKSQSTSQVTEMHPSSCFNLLAALDRLLTRCADTDATELLKFERWADHQLNVVGRPHILQVLYSQDFQQFCVDFDPCKDLLNRDWPEFKRHQGLIALYDGMNRRIDPNSQGCTVFIKKGERAKQDPPIEFIGDSNLTDDTRARPRLIAPSEGERHLLWIEQVFFRFAKTLFPNQFVQGKTPSELKAMFADTIQTVVSNSGQNECHSYVTDGSSYDSNQTDRITKAAWHPFVKYYGQTLSELLQQNEFFKNHIDPDRIKAYMDSAVESLCQLFVTFFVPLEGAAIPDEMFTKQQSQAVKVLARKGYKKSNLVPLTFACTGSGKNNTTRRNTWNNMFQSAYYLHCQGIEDVLWFGKEQFHTCLACAGDDVQGHSSAPLVDERELISTASRLHQKVKFWSASPLNNVGMLSLISFEHLDGTLSLVKNLGRLFDKTSYIGNNKRYLAEPQMYHAAIYLSLRHGQYSRVLEGIMLALVGRCGPVMESSEVAGMLATCPSLQWMWSSPPLDYELEPQINHYFGVDMGSVIEATLGCLTPMPISQVESCQFLYGNSDRKEPFGVRDIFLK